MSDKVDLENVKGSAPNVAKQQEDLKEITQQVADKTQNTAPAAQPAPAAPADPISDPKVQALIADLQNQLKAKDDSINATATKLAEIEAAQKEAERSKMNATEKLAAEMADLKQANSDMLAQLAQSEKNLQAQKFETKKAEILKDSGIPAKFHTMISAGISDEASLLTKVAEAKQLFHGLKEETVADVGAAISTQSAGTPAVGAAGPNPGTTPAEQQDKVGSILDKLTPEQASKINFNTVRELVHASPQWKEELLRAIGKE